jgi:hypothetical protein
MWMSFLSLLRSGLFGEDAKTPALVVRPSMRVVT